MLRMSEAATAAHATVTVTVNCQRAPAYWQTTAASTALISPQHSPFMPLCTVQACRDAAQGRPHFQEASRSLQEASRLQPLDITARLALGEVLAAEAEQLGVDAWGAPAANRSPSTDGTPVSGGGPPRGGTPPLGGVPQGMSSVLQELSSLPPTRVSGSSPIIEWCTTQVG